MKDCRILVVEDDRSVMHLITTSLKLNDYEYLTASYGKEAVSLCASQHPDIILLDLGLADMDGIEVIRTVRLWSDVPIIVISARHEDSDKIDALDTGADDYLTKPFSVDELMARIRAAARRRTHMHQAESENSVFTNGCLTIRYAEAAVFVNDKQIHLTPIEYRILCMLAKNCGKVLTHSYMISEIWGTGVETDIISLRVYMTSLRKKLSAGTDESMIRTHTSIGYQMIRM